MHSDRRFANNTLLGVFFRFRQLSVASHLLIEFWPHLVLPALHCDTVNSFSTHFFILPLCPVLIVYSSITCSRSKHAAKAQQPTDDDHPARQRQVLAKGGERGAQEFSKPLSARSGFQAERARFQGLRRISSEIATYYVNSNPCASQADEDIGKSFDSMAIID